MINQPYFKSLLAGAGAIVLAVTLSGCGGAAKAASGQSPTTVAGGANATGSSTGGGFPGASGSVAAISGSSMEVQNQQSGQVTVSWTSSTTFSQTVSVTSAAVAVGDCVTITGSNSTGALTANNVMVSQPDSSGNCTNGRFGRPSGGSGGGFPGGTPPNRGSLPTPPSGSGPGGRTGFTFANGRVTSVSPTSLTIYGSSAPGFGGTHGQGSTPPTTAKPTSVNVTLNSATRYSETNMATASSLAVGDCVTANGWTDSTGAVTAKSVRITSTGGQSCTNGFAPPGGGTNG